MIVGGNGKLGRFLTDKLSGDGVPVAVIDCRPIRRPASARVPQVIGDICQGGRRMQELLETAKTIVVCLPTPADSECVRAHCRANVPRRSLGGYSLGQD